LFSVVDPEFDYKHIDSDNSQPLAGSSAGYVNDKNQSIGDYIGDNDTFEQYPGHNPNLVRAKLGFTFPDTLTFAYLRGEYQQEQAGDDVIAGRWLWSPGASSVVQNGYAKLAHKIDAKILADQSPAPGAPTPTQAFSEGRAPIVVLFNIQYCHNWAFLPCVSPS
jgi:hypothetical protein